VLSLFALDGTTSCVCVDDGWMDATVHPTTHWSLHYVVVDILQRWDLVSYCRVASSLHNPFLTDRASLPK
jgi:hypothetical protein